MASRGGQPRGEAHDKKSKGKFLLQDKIATFYYTFGLFSITYPVYVLSFAILVIIVSWLPLINLPFPGKAPLVQTASLNSTDIPETFCYVQQVVLRVAVLPWESNLTLGDAFRAPLYETFKLLDIVRNHQDDERSKNLGHICLHIEAVKKTKHEPSNVLPQYSCLVLSPANLWQQDVHQFSQDSSLLSTVFNHHTVQKGKTSIAEMLFGMHLFNTGIKRYPIRNRQRIIQYAITLFFKEYDEGFINSLTNKLSQIYPLYQNHTRTQNFNLNDTVFIQYPEEINCNDLIPIVISFILLFLYYYFCVRKIELIKSKVGMAFTATLTVICSLTTTMGICFFFGLTLNFEGGKSIFPYLALLVGLENVIVLTKSVVSTPLHLDVKIRNAQGLSKEGWSITKNLLFEITVMTFGLFTFVPAIQEFCIFSIVGLIMDFFLQMFFFVTILGIDISRMANSTEMNHNFRNSLYQSQNFFEKPMNLKGLNRSKSHPRLSTFPANIVAGQKQGTQDKKIPKRVRLVNFWARTRFFQRSFMFLMIIWIAMIVYRSDIINQIVVNVVVPKQNDENNSTHKTEDYPSVTIFPPFMENSSSIHVRYVTYNPMGVQDAIKVTAEYEQNHIAGIEKLKHSDYAPWLKLSSWHWQTILQKYNISLSGKTIGVLSNIRLSHVISPEQAVLLRNPDEKYRDKFEWHALAVALDPIDFSDIDSTDTMIPQSEQPFYPTSPMEILLTTILCFISVLVLSYAVVVLYRCICSRNYAEWRASWFNEKGEESGEEQVLLEAVPVVLEGHQQEIECLATDGSIVVSTCLGGQLKIWDNNTGELLTNIDRNSHFLYDKCHDQSLDLDETFSDYESGSPPSREESFPKLLNKINTDFSHITENKFSYESDSKTEFNKSYRYFYFNHNYDVRLRQRHDHFQDDSKRCSFSEKLPKQKQVYSSESHKNKDESHGFRNNSVSSGKSGCLSRDPSDSMNCGGCKLSPIWCMDYSDNLIVVGCADGRLEFWESTTGKLKCVFEDGTDSGVNCVKMIGPKVIAVRLFGSLELFQLQTYNQGRPVDWNFTCAYRRMHVRTGSVGSISDRDMVNQVDVEEDLQLVKLHSTKAHQQPITCLDCEGGRILTGSQDHTLKVFRLDDTSLIYTLHGHCGPITCLFIDRVSPATSGSGSQDGMLCVWDLMTGACMYSIQAHDGSVTSLTYSASYVISLGTDERLCVWERFQGHLLNTIPIMQTFSNQVLMLAQHLVVTGKNGGLVIWDVRTGECVRTITLGHVPFVFIKQLILLRDAVLCDYGKQLRIVRFPLITHKFD